MSSLPEVPRIIDIFSGAGGLSLGFRQAGFQSVFAVELDPPAAATYAANFGNHVYRGDVRDVVSFAPYPAEVIVGGPPCQGFSPLGRMSATQSRLARHGELNALWGHYLRALHDVRPRAFVIENVPEFLASREYATFRAAAVQAGYDVAQGVLRAEDFGVPQKRRRGFVVGLRGGQASLPVPTFETLTVRGAIGDLPLDPTGEDLHWGRQPTPVSLERYRVVPPGGNRFDLMRARPDITPRCWLDKPTGSTDVFGRLRWDAPALTIRTEFFKPEKGCYLHPEAHRPITHREAARLQTFPDDFVFQGSRTEVARQIGNAVPPKLAAAVARHVRALLAPRGTLTGGMDRLPVADA
ncbi:DNA cytosine methyltransferase [Deinococcus aluminii]|uniref:Cytosine-specific methyltransferase n=1 Tax=Deinococcus aluminii TaxID=1656885 RepID=A0ABP9X8M5_9DEIO